MKKYLLSCILVWLNSIMLVQPLAAQAPVITNFFPAYGCAGNTQVIISGTDFTNVQAVYFGGTAAQSYIVDSSTQITAIPGIGITGPIEVVTLNGSDTSLQIFTVIAIPAMPNPLTATPDSICQGMTSALNAVSGGNLINWYTADTGGVLIGSSMSGIDFLVSPAVTTTYWAEVETPGPSTPQVFGFTGSIVNYTVPADVYRIRINAKGAQGGAGGTATPGSGGLGANMSGTFQVAPGQVLKILVGQQGGGNANTPGAGGGGASFVTDATNNPLIIAGGGGGVLDGVTAVGKDAVITTNGLNGYSTQAGYPTLHGVGGQNGNGAGNNGACSGNGAGLLSNGANNNGCCNGRFGLSFLNLGAGGTSCTGNADYGGYGGGGGGGNKGAGGGGGYSGGGGAYHTPVNGGGGGSFNIGTSQVNLVDNVGNGLVTIYPLPAGCISNDRTPVTVFVNTELYPNAWTGTGTISGNALGGLPPYTYSLDGAAFGVNGNFSNLCDGLHILTVKDQFGNGCTHDTNIYVQNLLETFPVETACVSFAFNGTILTSTGLYTDTLISAYGCDSIVHLDLNITPVDTSINQNGSTLIAGATGAQLQWFDCDAQSTIAWATGQQFTATQNGHYALIVTQNGCTDTSACLYINAAMVHPIEDFSGLSIYPNPAGKIFQIRSEKPFSELMIFDRQMRKIQQIHFEPCKEKTWENHALPDGLYFIKTENSPLRKLLIRQ